MNQITYMFATQERKETLEKAFSKFFSPNEKVCFKTKSVKTIDHLIRDNKDDKLLFILDEEWWKKQRHEDLEEFLSHEHYGTTTYVFSEDETLLKGFKNIKKQISFVQYSELKTGISS